MYHALRQMQNVQTIGFMTVGSNARRIRRAKGLTLEQVAAQLGTDTGNLSRLERDKQGYTDEGVRKLATALGVEVAELFAEEPKAPYFSRSEVAPAVASNLLGRPEVFEVPVHDARFSMGHGAEQPAQDTVVDHLRLAGTWVRQHLPGISSTLNLAVVTGYGNSMSPVFNDGDVLLVDRGVREIKTDQIYALSFRDELYIKWIQRFPDGSLKIVSENKTFEPIHIPKDQVEGVTVHGRIVWAWNGKKL